MYGRHMRVLLLNRNQSTQYNFYNDLDKSLMPLAKKYAEIERITNPIKKNINLEIISRSITNSGKPSLLDGLSRFSLIPIKSIILIIKLRTDLKKYLPLFNTTSFLGYSNVKAYVNVKIDIVAINILTLSPVSMTFLKLGLCVAINENM